MSYLYYPGCSLEGTSVEYDISTRALMKWAGASLEEITDWTCCGASAAESVSMLLSHMLPARNLALAETMSDTGQILVPCSACYLNLKKTREAVQTDKELLEKINQVLLEENLSLSGSVKVRHLLDVLSSDLDTGMIRETCDNRMAGLVVAPYYGCQCLRPFHVFDDPEDPHSMDALIRATGAVPLEWQMGGQCCGASHTSTDLEHGLALIEKILSAAEDADLIVTVCPMCQMNLEGYQKKISGRLGKPVDIPILFLPQFLGLALGRPPGELGLDLNLSKMGELLQRI